MSTFTKADLERARDVGWPDIDGGYDWCAQLIADIRNETIERCAVEIECAWRALVSTYLAERLRALKDGGT